MVSQRRSNNCNKRSTIGKLALVFAATLLVFLGAVSPTVASPCGAAVDMPVSNVQGLGILGALYDYRKNKVIPGNFWPEELLKKKHNTYQVSHMSNAKSISCIECQEDC
jgi:hypothetical protein